MRLLNFSFCVLVAATSSLSVTDSKSEEPGKAGGPVAERTSGKKAGEARDDNELKMQLVWCPPGTFMSFDDESEGQLEVTLTKGFWLGRYEVTQAEWKQVMMTEPWKDKRIVEEEFDELPPEGAAFPATFVSHQDALALCRKLTERERTAGRLAKGWEYTLPTEAQWEYACRAGTATRFNFGDDESKLGEYAWFGRNTGEEFYAREVGRKKPNAWGLYDMHGNVAEWCRDWYGHRPLAGRDPENQTDRNQYRCRVCRGGSWRLSAEWCLSSRHGGASEYHRLGGVGFRVALGAVPPAEPEDEDDAESPSDE